MRIYNTLSRSVEQFEPLNTPNVGMYSCGPTVYDYQHIGHMRRYVGDDLLIRVLKANKFDVHHVMNITDVGHLVSDADSGEDKMEKGARKFGLSVWDIAKKFETQFKDSCKALNIALPQDLMHAIGYIPEQIELIKKLEEKGFSYKTSDGIYFDTSKLKDYGKLALLQAENLKAGKRIDMGEKKNKTDFALWKFSPKNEKRQQEWESPWGVGFPGWHIECSAMSSKFLGKQFDIHTGGEDHIPIHHTNEIAQSEAAFGKKPWVRYWLHNAFLTTGGKKASKSKGGLYTVSELEELGYKALDYRYFCLQTHYRKNLEFSLENLKAAKTAYDGLKNKIKEIDLKTEGISGNKYEADFKNSINDDLNTAKALQVLIALLKDEKVSGKEKVKALKEMDSVLGLDLLEKEKIIVPAEIKKLVAERESARKNKDWKLADKLRENIEKLGFRVSDSDKGSVVEIL